MSQRITVPDGTGMKRGLEYVGDAVQIYGLLRPKSWPERRKILTQVLALMKAEDQALDLPAWCQKVG